MATGVEELVELGRRVRRLREAQGLSQEDVSRPAFSAAYLSHIENGKRRASHETLSHIAGRLGVTVGQLLTGRDPDDDLRLEIDIQRAISSIHLGEAATARARLERARREAVDASNERALLRADEGLGLALYRLGEHDRAYGIFTRAEERAHGLPAEERTSCRVGRARCLFRLDDPHQALHLLETHLAELRLSEPADPTALVQTFAAMIPPYVETGLIHKAQKVATEGWELAPQVGDPEQRACLYVNRAGLLLKQDQPREAMASLALAEDMFRQLGWHGEGLGVTLMRALALLEDESYPEAETLLRDVLRGPEGSLTATDRAQALTHLARVSRLQGDPNEGLTHAREALVVGGHLAAVAAEAHRELGMCVAQTSSDESAVEHWQEALGLFQALQNKEEAAKTARLIGELLLEAGRPEAAASAFREGLSLLGQYR